MSIILLKEITTEEALSALEAEGKKYTGLYVDMDDAKQRKYVKDSAALISGLLKKLDRARIDKSKVYKASIEAEASEIKARLEASNAPFSNLIDEHNAKRKILLDAKKAAEEAEALALKLVNDHEMALLMNAEHDRQCAATIEQARLDQIAHDEAIALEATQKAERDAADAIAKAEADKQAAIFAAKVAEEKAKQDKIDTENAAKQAKIDAENAAKQTVIDAENAAKQAAEKAEQDKQTAIQAEKQRQANEAARVKADQEARERNKQHKGRVNSQAKADLMQYAGLTEEQAIKVVKALANRKISAVQISY